MTYDNVIQIFNTTLEKISKDNINRFLKNHHSDVHKYILEHTKFLDKFINSNTKKISIFERIYCITHNLYDRPRCQHCNSQYVCGFNITKNEYKKWCSPKCQASDKSCIEKSKQSRILLYNNENYNGLEKSRKTRLAKNNGSWHNDEFVKKLKETKLQKYGNENYVNSEKSAVTKYKKYGNRNYVNNEKNRITRKTNFYNNVLLTNDFFIPLFSKDEYISGNKHTIFQWKCKKCGSIINSHINYNYKCQKEHLHEYVRCFTCNPIEINKISQKEIELQNFIKTLSNDVQTQVRNIIFPYELDILIKNNKIAFEFDGLYWHSSINGKDKNYHIKKTEMCEQHDIQLIHIFEDEYDNKLDIIKSRIKNLLGIYDNVVFARKCQIREIDSNTSNQFQDKNHIQGAVNSKVNLGLFYNDEMISLMTFSKPRFDKKHEWELVRFCNKLGYHIPGAAGKLLKYFERNYNPKSLVSYADRRWSKGNLYEKLGFTLHHISEPDYWYLDGFYKCRLSRIKFQKHKLKNILKNYDEALTEQKNMLNNKYSIIYDCGNYVFEKIYK